MSGSRLRRLAAAGVGAALLALAPEPAQAVTLLGSDFLSPGRIWDPGLSLFGEALSPRLDLDGRVRTQFIYQSLGNDHQALFVPQVDLQLNLQLTATQRIFALFRPLEHGDREPTFHRFDEPSGWTTNFDGMPQSLYYEGQPLNWISPDDRWPLDFSIAGGRVPLLLHDGFWFNNFFDGVAVAKNNIQLGTLSNLNVLWFLTRGQTQPGITLQRADRLEQEKNLTGLDVNLDWYDWFAEASWAMSYDNARRRDPDLDLDRHFLALSVTRTFSFDLGLSVRALGSTGNATADGGALFAVETQWGLLGTLLYVNGFGATRDWIPPSVQGSPLSRTGILFTFNRLVATPQLNPRGADSAGGVIGDILNPRGSVTLAGEFGGLADFQNPGNDQLGVALQLQLDLAKLLIPGDDTGAMVRRGLLYGALVRFTALGIRNENRELAGSRYDFGTNLELIYEF